MNEVQELKQEIQNLKSIIAVLVDSINATEGRLSSYDAEGEKVESYKCDLLLKLSELLQQNNIETEHFL